MHRGSSAKTAHDNRQRRSHHNTRKPAALSDAASKFRRTGRAGAGARTGCRELSLPLLFILLFEHILNERGMLMKLYLDPGHGGSDSGAQGNGMDEKNINLDIAQRIRTILTHEYSDVDVRMSRTDDSTKSLTQRTNEANW